jgi:tetratricopeptide (TPR) repeat protein
MQRIKPLILIILFCGTSVFGCINTISEGLSDGTILWSDEKSQIPLGHNFKQFDKEKTLEKLYKFYDKTKNIKYLSDVGVVLILQQKYIEAKDIYLKIEEIDPTRYATASNLGTVYELLGDNENALTWIKKAVEINPKSHQNSEWIHVKILETKIKGEQSITSDSLINTNFGTSPNPTTTLSPQQLAELRDALYFQLNERVSFIKPPDKIIANLMYDLANVTFLTGGKDAAITIYEKAREYSFTDEILQSRIYNAKGIPQPEKPVSVEEPKQSNYFIWIFEGLSGLVMIAISIIVIKRKKEITIE